MAYCKPCRKAGHTSAGAAHAARRHTPEAVALHVYGCPHTKGVWHVGHRNSRDGALSALERAAKRGEQARGAS